MPLIKSSSDKARQENIKEMIDAGHPINQSVAASYHNQHEERQKERHEHEKRKYGQ